MRFVLRTSLFIYGIEQTKILFPMLVNYKRASVNEQQFLFHMSANYRSDIVNQHRINCILKLEEEFLDKGRFINFVKIPLLHVFSYTDDLDTLQNIKNSQVETKFENCINWIGANVHSKWNLVADIVGSSVTLIFSFEDEKLPILMKLLV